MDEPVPGFVQRAFGYPIAMTAQLTEAELDVIAAMWVTVVRKIAVIPQKVR